MILKFSYLFIVIMIAMGCEDICNQYYNRNVRPLNINSLLIDKYFDSTYKDLPRLIIIIDNEEKMIGPAGHDTTFYNKVKIGDRLIKERGSLMFTVIRGNDTTYEMMDCENR